MARKTIHVLIDDLDGSEGDQTVRFALDGVNYEIDLSKKNAQKIRDAFAPYVAAGTKLGKGTFGGVMHRPSASNGAADDYRREGRAVREWALQHGIPVNDRGRISEELREQYRKHLRGEITALVPQQSTPEEAVDDAKARAEAVKAAKGGRRRGAPVATRRKTTAEPVAAG